MTKSRIEQIKRRCAAAADGPWIECDILDDGGGGVVLEDGSIVFKSGAGLKNSCFTANARTDLPDAIAEIEKVRAVLQDMIEWSPSTAKMACRELGWQIIDGVIQ